MIIDVHQRFLDAFAMLPKVGGYPANGDIPANEGYQPNYDWGNELHLNQLIRLYHNDNENPYPLIYNISNVTSQDSKKELASYDNLSLILATRNTCTELVNPQRWATSYKNILFPLANNIVTLFEKNAIFQWTGEFELLEFPNYGENDENMTTDIWDALRIDTSITINNQCTTKYINFKNI